MMSDQLSERKQEWRDEWLADRADGNDVQYVNWLEQKFIDLERDCARNDMGATENFRLWQEAQSRNEQLTDKIDRLEGCISRIRGWLDDKGYSRAVHVLNEFVEWA